MTGRRLSATVPPEPPEGSVVLGEKTGLAWQRGKDQWCAPPVHVGGVSWLVLLDREGSVTTLRDSGYDGPTPEIIAAAESERETWRMARAQLAQALGCELDMSWFDLLEIVRNDQKILKGVGR